MSESEWDRRLKATGFTGLDLIFRDHDDPELFSVSLMVSTNLPIVNPSLPESVVIVKPVNSTDELHQLSADVSASLQKSGVSVSTTYLDALTLMDLEGKVCVSLVETESPLLSDINAGEFEAVNSTPRAVLDDDIDLDELRGHGNRSGAGTNTVASLGRQFLRWRSPRSGAGAAAQLSGAERGGGSKGRNKQER